MVLRKKKCVKGDFIMDFLLLNLIFVDATKQSKVRQGKGGCFCKMYTKGCHFSFQRKHGCVNVSCPT